jgi:Ca2+-binding RTX toxin-like protein
MMSSYVFVDSRVQDYVTLLAGLAPDTEVIVLDSMQDGVTQIAHALEGVTDLDAIHIISHGSEGVLYLGDTVLTGDNLSHYTSELEAIGAALTSTGDILLYGCEVANGITGRSFIENLALYTGADVAASTDITGSSTLNGDWALEASTGAIEINDLLTRESQEAYLYTLADFVPGDISTTFSVAVGGSVSGEVDVSGDQDWYRVSLVAGHTYQFDLQGASTGQGTLGDSYLTLLNGAGAVIVADDDSGEGTNSLITYTASQSGTHHLSAAGYSSHTGTFLLSVLEHLDLDGTSGNDTLTGGTGNDTLDGAAGADSLVGGAGHDSLIGGTGNDTLSGGAGNDTLNGGAGNDVIDGGAGDDILAYGGVSSGYSLNLVNGNLVVTDTDSSNGSDGTDTLIGNYESVGFSGGAELLHASGDFRVNTTTTNYLVNPSIAALAGGGFVVTWQDPAQDGSSNSIYAQRYSATGAALGGEFRVNTTTLNDQSMPAITALTGGGFVVTWQDNVLDGSGYGVYAQRYNATGVAQGSEFRVNTTTENYQDTPAIAALTGGGFVVTWQSYSQDGSGYGVYAQRYDSNGVVQGSEFLINTTTTNDQFTPAIAALTGGGFVVTWQDNALDGSGYGIYAQRLTAAGAAAGVEFRVNTTTADYQSNPAIAALTGGGFVVTWQDSALDGNGNGVYAQRYDSNGVTQGSEFRVNTTTANYQDTPAIAALTGGGFVVTWQDNALDGSGYGIYAQRYNAAGVAQGGEFQVNSYTSSDQQNPSIAALSDGGFVVSWQSYQDLGGYGIYAQRYDAAGNKILMQITGDGGNNALIWTQAGGVALSGAAGNDTLTSGTGNDTLDGGAGDDTITGGSGNDTASYESAFFTVTVSLAIAGAQNTVYAGSDTLSGIENLRGGAYNDTLTGNGSGNVLTGASGNDTLAGGAGNDTLDGNGGIDTATYASSSSAVTANLSSGAVTDGLGGSDTLFNIENVIGSNQADTLTGNADANQLTGGLGNDTLTGGAGNDTLDGGAGNDVLDGGTGVNTLVYAGASSGYSLNLVNGNLVVTDTDSSNGSDGTDTLIGNYESVGFSGGAEVFRANGEFRVNTTTSSSQLAPAITALPNGGFVVTWDDSAQEGSVGVYAQRYDASGAAAGSEFRVNTTTLNFQSNSAVTALSNGGFVVTWQDSTQDGNSYGVYAQRYDANGSAVGGEFRVNTTVLNSQFEPAVAGLSDGGFVVTWQDNGTDGSGYGIYAQRYDANGAVTGGEFLINNTTSGNQQLPAITALPNGGFVVTWQSADVSGTGIFARRYDAGGTALGTEFQVNTATASTQETAAIVALADGGFVVTWQSNLQDGSSNGIYAQRYDSNGVAAGAEFIVNATTVNNQIAPAITALADGGFVVTWQDSVQDGSTWGIYAQRYDASGAAVGGEFRVNTFLNNDQQTPAVTALADGGFVVSWRSTGQDGDGYSIHAQRYDAAGNKVLTQVTGDNGNNVLTWTQAGGIVLDGAGGNDTLNGSTGNDTLTGGFGDDVINGGTGTDWASYSGNSAVTVNLSTAGAQNTVGAGSDTLTSIENLLGGAGGDSLTGNGSNNTLSGAGGNDTINGAGGADLLDGGQGNDSVSGGTGADTLIGGGGTDTLNGDSGNDLFIVDATTATTAAGGADKDVYLLRPINANVSYTVTDFQAGLNGDQIDVRTLLANTPTYVDGNPFDGALGFLQVLQVGLDTHLQWDIDGIAGPSGWVTRLILTGVDDSALTGGTNGNFLGPIIGTNAADTLIGAAGTDVIIALAGDDILDGGDGNDLMRGDAGNDLYYVDNVGDIVVENNNGPEGLFAAIADIGDVTDTVIAAVNYSLTQFVENLTLSGAATTGSGNELNNVITGNNLANTLYGLDGNDSLAGAGSTDTVWGGLGDDTLTGGTGADVFAIAAGNGVDLITDFTDIDAIQVSGLLLTAALTAGNGSNVLANQVQVSAGGGVTTVHIGIDGVAGADLSVQLSGTFAANQLRLKNGDILINHAPTVANVIITQNANEDGAFNFIVPLNTFSDTDAGDTLTYSATKSDNSALPSWLTFNANTRTFSGTPLNEHVGNLGIKLIATDSSLASTAHTFTLTVINTNDAPTLANAIADQPSAQINNPFNFTFNANTFTDVDVGDIFTYSATRADGTPLPAWLAFNANTRTFSGMPLVGDIGELNVKVIAADSSNVTIFDTFIIPVITDDDLKIGTAGNDTLTGGTGNDTLVGGDGDDSLNGGTGIDTASYAGAGSAVAVNLGNLAAQNTGGAGIDTLSGFENLTGSDHDDTLTGGTIANLLKGELGHDNLNGGLGNDSLEGGDGDDTLTGSTGDDSLAGGAGLDWAYYNGAGSAVTINLATTAAQNTGGAGTDTLNTIEHVLGSNYNDTLTGNSAANQLDGGAGNDTIDGGLGNDTMKGGSGNDTYIVNAAGDVIIEGAGGGTDSVLSSVTHTLAANVEHLTLTGVGNASANGNTLANSLTGNSGNNTLNGGTGNDTMIGGLGNDTYVVNAAGDVVTEGVGAGTDTVQASTSHTLGANVEHLTLTGAGNSSGNGNSLDNILTGNSKNNALNGGTGNDTMVGGAGNDTYSVNAAGDIVTEGNVAGTDTVNASINYSLTDWVENLNQTGSADTSGSGNSQDNKLIGNGGNNTLSGNDGADTIIGGSGNDTLTGGTGIDTFDYNALTDAADTITDFVAGAGGDRIDIDTLMTVLGYGGADPIGAGYVNLLQAGADVQVQIDSDGGGDNFATTLVTLQNVTAGNVTLADNFIV